MTCTSDSYVEPTLTACERHWAEVHGQMPSSVFTESRREVDNVALITLNAFQIFNENLLVLVVSQEAIKSRVFADFSLK
ncbi:hypothetical protein D9M68_909860 [compost metagenome]